jgi:hypothetical protein
VNVEKMSVGVMVESVGVEEVGEVEGVEALLEDLGQPESLANLLSARLEDIRGDIYLKFLGYIIRRV